MGHYATEVKEATCYIHKSDFPKLLEDIKVEVNLPCWDNYGWRKSVLNAETLEDVAKEFGIKLVDIYGNYVVPVIENAYVSHFFDVLIEIAAPYMTNGKIIVDDEYETVTIKYKAGCVIKK